MNDFMETDLQSTQPKAIKQSPGDSIFHAVIVVILGILNLIMIYPFLYVIATAISDRGQVLAGNVWLYPIGIDTTAIRQILKYPNFLNSYKNTIIYAVFGTITAIMMTAITAYPLSRKKFRMRGFFSVVYVITMFFGGGMIPTFLVYRSLGLVDNRLVMILPGALGAYNIILCRTFFQDIPESLFESCYLDGASDWTVLWKIVMPLSKPVLATISLFTAVSIWNDYFTGLLYFNDAKKYPLQVILRMILIEAQQSGSSEEGIMIDFMSRAPALSLKSASIIISIIPIIMVYPFVQKHFVKGVMIGSVKG